MHTDAFGAVHPDPQDVPTLVGALHVAECGECRKTFGEETWAACQQLGDTYEREQRERARIRK